MGRVLWEYGKTDFYNWKYFKWENDFGYNDSELGHEKKNYLKNSIFWTSSSYVPKHWSNSLLRWEQPVKFICSVSLKFSI